MYPSVQEAMSLHTFGRETPVDGDRLACWWAYAKPLQDMVNKMVADVRAVGYAFPHEDNT
ncbi:hypothetical protein SEA_YUUY_31 [Microbacterium phage YuuY]|nr:hypothetical protein SEA_YUUY_31 [Microbacterium phage YuuY]